MSRSSAAVTWAWRQPWIKVTLRGYPSGTYYADFAGVPSYVHQHDLGLAIGAWGADWPDGYGFLYNLVAGPAIAPAANPNISELDDRW
jgi:peptide/nickel transport system substrate-binding protein